MAVEETEANREEAGTQETAAVTEERTAERTQLTVVETEFSTPLLTIQIRHN